VREAVGRGRFGRGRGSDGEVLLLREVDAEGNLVVDAKLRLKVGRRDGVIRLRSIYRRRGRVKGVLRLPRGRRQLCKFRIENGDVPRDGAGSNALRSGRGRRRRRRRAWWERAVNVVSRRRKVTTTKNSPPRTSRNEATFPSIASRAA
jgi:hypothetical protein